MKFNECNTYYQVAAAGLPFCHGCGLRWWSIKHCWIWWLISVEGSWLEWLEQWRMGSIVPIGHCSSHSSWINGIHGRDGTNGRTGMAGLGQIRIGRWQSQPEEWAEDTPAQLNVTDGVGKLPVHQTKWWARSCAMRINNSPCCLVDTLPIGNMWQPTVGMFWACPSVVPGHAQNIPTVDTLQAGETRSVH